MNQAVKKYRKELLERRSRPSGVVRVLKAAGMMLLMGILGAWAAALAFPIATRLGLSEAAASRLPSYAFLAGLGAGLAISLFQSVKEIFAALFQMFVAGVGFWLFGLLFGGLLLLFGVPEWIDDWAPWVWFGAGMLLGLLRFAEVTYEEFEKLLARFKARMRRRS